MLTYTYTSEVCRLIDISFFDERDALAFTTREILGIPVHISYPTRLDQFSML